MSMGGIDMGGVCIPLAGQHAFPFALGNAPFGWLISSIERWTSRLEVVLGLPPPPRAQGRTEGHAAIAHVVDKEIPIFAIRVIETEDRIRLRRSFPSLPEMDKYKENKVNSTLHPWFAIPMLAERADHRMNPLLTFIKGQEGLPRIEVEMVEDRCGAVGESKRAPWYPYSTTTLSRPQPSIEEGGGDDVQRSIELLDRVLSEFDDVENANQVQNVAIRCLEDKSASYKLHLIAFMCYQLTTSTSTPQIRQNTNSSTSTSSARTGNVPASTPDDESPSLGHQSEDDGYMSMNGRKPKFSLSFKPLAEVPVHHEVSHSPSCTLGILTTFRRLRRRLNGLSLPYCLMIQQLVLNMFYPVYQFYLSLSRVSPAHRPKTAGGRNNRSFPLTQLPPRMDTIPPPQRFQNNERTPVINGMLDPIHTATQTTLPKTKHQRPYGWENNDFTLNPPPPPPGYRFGSLPYQHGIYPLISPTRVPPRTVPTAIERHREVKRHGSEDNLSSDLDETPALRPLSELADDEHFSDDSLEEMLLPPPPPPATKEPASLGSTKVIGRRRRKSGSYSSTSSIPNRLKDLDDWPDPPHVLPRMRLLPHFRIQTIMSCKDRKNLVNLGSSLTSNSSLNSRLSSELSIPASRFSMDLNSRLSRELQTPNSRYSVDLSTPHSRLSQELNSPKSRYSLDLNNSRILSQEFSSSPSRLSVDLSSSRSSTPSRHSNDVKRHSTTFDNIKSLVREGVIEDFDTPIPETADDIVASTSPIVRVVSLPSLNADEFTPRRELDVTVEEEEELECSLPSVEISPLRKIEQNISELLERRDIDAIQDDRCILNGVENLNKEKREKRRAPSKPSRNGDRQKANDLQKSSSHNEIQKSEDYYRQLLLEEREESRPLPTSTSADFPVRVEVLQHEFPPLPPSPVEEDDDEYSEILHPVQKPRADTLPNSNEPPVVPLHRETVSNSLKTRSMDVNYNRGRRTNFYNSSNRNIPPERRTLPSELQDAKRRPFQKRSSQQSPQEEHHLQTSCSLPETPIFARGCDIPRTPHRRAPDIPGGNQTAPRQSNTIGSLNTIGNLSTGGYRRGMSQSGLEQAIVGAELIRLAGGPGEGWYPKQRHRRPASIEHLDRTAPRDALRRVTSLLIKKVVVCCFVPGNNSKEPKKEKEIVSPTIHENVNVSGEEVQKKKGFFKNFWKRSRHYSLEQQ
ncbi:hypothetical protein NQ317_001225 [Molorchus minor]|uniref:Uncharacterized protein n=1 Tax=Molorchus minor TaxID=1323400 RepID=A0ABQ9JCE7_9CUCU|nr:hypothetical protein NQ317_001225 [Molorchus minor]